VIGNPGSRLKGAPESDSGVDLGVPIGEAVAGVRVKRVVHDDEETLVATLVVQIDTGVRLQRFQQRLQTNHDQ